MARTPPAAPSSGPAFPASRRDLRRAGGQASVEHAAIVALVACVLVVGGALGWAPSIVNAVHSAVRRALCVAGGDRCAEFHTPRPCVVARGERRQSVGVSFAVWRVGRSAALVREERSDGTVTLTWYDDIEGGVGLSIGLDLGGGRRVTGSRRLVTTNGGRVGGTAHERHGEGGGISLKAGIEARLGGGWGRTWRFPNGTAADAFARRLVHGGDDTLIRETSRRAIDALRGRGLPAPDVERVRVGVSGTVTGEASGPLGLKAGGSVLAGLQGEGTYDKRTGRITVALGLPGEVAGRLAGPLGLRLAGRLRVDRSATLVLDRDGRPRELGLLGALGTRNGTRRREVEIRLDLTRPEVGDALRRTLAALRSGDPSRAIATAEALGRWAAQEGAIDQREYRVGEDQHTSGAMIALGLKLGAEQKVSRSAARLVSARSRPPGGIWEDRHDCVG